MPFSLTTTLLKLGLKKEFSFWPRPVQEYFAGPYKQCAFFSWGYGRRYSVQLAGGGGNCRQSMKLQAVHEIVGSP